MSTGIGIGVSSVFIKNNGAVAPSPTDLILLEDGIFFITLEDNSGLVALEN